VGFVRTNLRVASGIVYCSLTSGSGDQRSMSLLAFLHTSMNRLMAVGAEGNQILACIVAKLAAEADVVNLEMLRGATILASPAIPLEYLCAKSMVGCKK